MSEPYQSSSHSKWICRYHVVVIPKRRRKMVFRQTRKHLGLIFHELAGKKVYHIVEGRLLPDHVHMCIEIPPKFAVASIVCFLKRKTEITIARQFPGKERNFTGKLSGVRGYAVLANGFELEQVRAYLYPRTGGQRQ